MTKQQITKATDQVLIRRLDFICQQMLTIGFKLKAGWAIRVVQVEHRALTKELTKRLRHAEAMVARLSPYVG